MLIRGAGPAIGPSAHLSVPARLRRPRIAALARAQLDAITSEVSESLSYAGHQYPDARVSQVLISGGGAGLPGCAEYFASRLRLDARTITPAMLSSSAGAGGIVCGNDHPAAVIAVGLARYGVETAACLHASPTKEAA